MSDTILVVHEQTGSRNLGSSPRDDLRVQALDHKPPERGFEYSFQQYDGTDLAQWHRRNGVFWRPCGPLLRIQSSEPSHA